MAFAFDCLIERFASGAGDRIFARRINIGQHQPIRSFKCAEKFIEEISRPGVTMGLKNYRQWPLPAVADRADGGANLRRVMAVIVDDKNPFGLAFNFETPMDAGESAERVGDLSERNFQLTGA